MDQQNLVSRQFGDTACNYLTSAVHAQGTDLVMLTDLVSKLHPTRALDLGCGAGHACFAMASGGASAVVAYDLSEQMLAVVANEATSRKLDSIATQQGCAEHLPFADRSFDLVVTRFSAHHWLDIHRSLTEIARVSKPDSTLVIIDIIAPETPLYDTALQTVELLRDASHVRNYRLSEWQQMLTHGGFNLSGLSQWKLHLDFNSWITRIGTSIERVQALHTVFSGLPTEVKHYFKIKEDHSFTTDSAWIQASRFS